MHRCFANTPLTPLIGALGRFEAGGAGRRLEGVSDGGGALGDESGAEHAQRAHGVSRPCPAERLSAGQGWVLDGTRARRLAVDEEGAADGDYAPAQRRGSLRPRPAAEGSTGTISQGLSRTTGSERQELERCRPKDTEAALASGAGAGDDDCVVTKVTRVDDPIMSIEVPSDVEDEGAAPAAASSPPAPECPVLSDSDSDHFYLESDPDSDQSKGLLSPPPLAPVPQVITALFVQSA